MSTSTSATAHSSSTHQGTTRLLRHWRRTLGSGLLLLALIAISLIILAPILYALVTSLRTPVDSFTNPPAWIPVNPQLSNYQSVFNQIPLGNYIFNSFFVTAAIVVGQLATS